MNDDGKGLKMKITAVFAVFILLVIILFAAAGIILITTPPSPGIGKITVDIYKREANVTVELLLDDDVDIEDSSLSLQFADRDLPLEINGHVLSGKIGIIEFRTLMDLSVKCSTVPFVPPVST